MITTGQTFENPVTGEREVLLPTLATLPFVEAASLRGGSSVLFRMCIPEKGSLPVHSLT